MIGMLEVIPNVEFQPNSKRCHINEMPSSQEDLHSIY